MIGGKTESLNFCAGTSNQQTSRTGSPENSIDRIIKEPEESIPPSLIIARNFKDAIGRVRLSSLTQNGSGWDGRSQPDAFVGQAARTDAGRIGSDGVRPENLTDLE